MRDSARQLDWCWCHALVTRSIWRNRTSSTTSSCGSSIQSKRPLASGGCRNSYTDWQSRNACV